MAAMWHSWSCIDYQETLWILGFPWTSQWWRQWHLIIINYVDGADITQLNWHQLGKSQWRFWATTRPLPSLSHIEMIQVMQFWSLSYPDNKRWKLFAVGAVTQAGGQSRLRQVSKNADYSLKSLCVSSKRAATSSRQTEKLSRLWVPVFGQVQNLEWA